MKDRYKRVYQFKIELRGIEPPVWRRIQVSESYTFWDLHVAIQDSMGWFDYHLHSFHVVNPQTGKNEEMVCYIDPMEGSDKQILIYGWDKTIADYFSPENSHSLYEYDFGDSWNHDIVLEEILPRQKNTEYPICISGENACPPEDCGGVMGYMNMLDIIKDPSHEDYEEFMEWLGGKFDSTYFDKDKVVFDNPRERWDEAFGETDDPDEDYLFELNEIPNETEAKMKILSRNFIRNIWEKVKTGEFNDLPPEEYKLALIMKEHEEEFFNQFEFADITYDHEYNPDEEVNPFLHIFIHSIIENQLEERNPIEVFQFYNSMKKKNCSRHVAIHLIGTILAPLMLPVLQNSGPFDIDTYKYLLKKYKNRKPEKIPDLLDKEDTIFF